MEDDVGGLARRFERAHQRGRHPRRLGHRHAAVHADDLDVFDRRERGDQLFETARREHERVPAGEDHLPDLAMRANIGDRRFELRARKTALPSNHFAAETKAAIGSADVDRLEQHSVGIAMHDALDRAMDAVADRVAHLLGPAGELGLLGNELARDGVGSIGGIDEVGEIGGERQRVARGHRFDSGAAFRRDQPRREEIVGSA